MKREDFQLYSQDLFYKGEAIPSNEYTKFDRIVKELLEEIEKSKKLIVDLWDNGNITYPLEDDPTYEAFYEIVE